MKNGWACTDRQVEREREMEGWINILKSSRQQMIRKRMDAGGGWLADVIDDFVEGVLDPELDAAEAMLAREQAR